MPNLQRVKAVMPNGKLRYIRASASANKKGLVVKAPRRTWKKETAKAQGRAEFKKCWSEFASTHFCFRDFAEKHDNCG